MLLCVVVSGVVFLHYAVIWARALYQCSFIIRENDPVGLALVLASPAIGHIYPLFHKGRGGKGIATTFGSLLYILFTDITDYAAFLQNDRLLRSIFYYIMSYAGGVFSKAWISADYDSGRNTVCIK